MQPSRHLSQLRKSLAKYLYKLRVLVDEGMATSWPFSDRLVCHATIETFNIWVNFSRAYYLSLSLKPITETGTKVSLGNTGIKTFHDALDESMRVCKNGVWKKGGWTRRDEPPWQKPDTILKSAQAIKCSNYTNIITAYGVPTNVFNDLPKFRHFFAHRNDDTTLTAKNVARNYSISVALHPSKILTTPAYGRPQALLLDWIDDLRIVSELLCQ